MGTPPNPRWRAREAYYDPGVSPAPRGPMKMPKPSEEAKAAFARVVPDEPAVTLKPMFGQMSAFVNGNMFCGIYGEELVVRAPPASPASGEVKDPSPPPGGFAADLPGEGDVKSPSPPPGGFAADPPASGEVKLLSGACLSVGPGPPSAE